MQPGSRHKHTEATTPPQGTTWRCIHRSPSHSPRHPHPPTQSCPAGTQTHTHTWDRKGSNWIRWEPEVWTASGPGRQTEGTVEGAWQRLPGQASCSLHAWLDPPQCCDLTRNGPSSHPLEPSEAIQDGDGEVENKLTHLEARGAEFARSQEWRGTPPATHLLKPVRGGCADNPGA